MKIVFNKELTDKQILERENYNLVARKRRRFLGVILSVITGAAVPILTQFTGKLFLSFLLSIAVGVFLLPQFFMDFVPAFKLQPVRPAFLYAAMLAKARNARIELDGIKKDKCTLTLLAEMANGTTIKGMFSVPVKRKGNITEEIVDLECDVVYLPNKFDE